MDEYEDNIVQSLQNKSKTESTPDTPIDQETIIIIDDREEKKSSEPRRNKRKISNVAMESSITSIINSSLTKLFEYAVISFLKNLIFERVVKKRRQIIQLI
jgi:hypothetical protein